jgi:hypothetical protein
MLLAMEEEEPYKVNFTLASSGITVVEQLRNIPKFKSMNIAVTAQEEEKVNISILYWLVVAAQW